MNQYAKAVTAGLIAALSALGAALTDGGVSASEWVAVALAFLVALGGVWSIPNADPRATHPSGPQDPDAV